MPRYRVYANVDLEIEADDEELAYDIANHILTKDIDGNVNDLAIETLPANTLPATADSRNK